MQIQVHEDKRIVCVWLTKDESSDAETPAQIKKVIAQFRPKKYLSAIYTVEKLALPLAGLIQGAVLLLDYLLIYLLNGWLKPSLTTIFIFIGIFAAVFCAIWMIVYLCVHRQIRKLNKSIGNT